MIQKAPTRVPVTIIDVARAAGVSKTTASDALSDRGRVSSATRDAVLLAAEQLGYSINRSARSLRTATTGAIGLYIPQVLVRSEHYLSFVYGAVNEAAAFDYDVTVIVAAAEARPTYSPHVDGIVVIDPVVEDPMITRLLATGLPIVSSERLPGGRQPAGVVWSNHAQYTTLLLEHLTGHGARHPALIASTTNSDWSNSVQSAYLDWCRTLGVEPRLEVAPFGADPASLQRTARELLASAPDTDALIGAGDGVATAISHSLAADGWKIGNDILLASCVDSSNLRASHPPITAIDTKGGEAGQACARLLFDLLQGRAESGTSQELSLNLNLRESTAGSLSGQ